MWKQNDRINRHIKMKSNFKVDGCYKYTNYACKTHDDCNAQVSIIYGAINNSSFLDLK
jgi:hypothetical protein